MNRFIALTIKFWVSYVPLALSQELASFDYLEKNSKLRRTKAAAVEAKAKKEKSKSQLSFLEHNDKLRRNVTEGPDIPRKPAKTAPLIQRNTKMRYSRMTRVPVLIKKKRILGFF